MKPSWWYWRTAPIFVTAILVAWLVSLVPPWASGATAFSAFVVLIAEGVAVSLEYADKCGLEYY